MSVFKNLLYLYRKSRTERTPEEDFCTECLAGILNSDQTLLNQFVNEVLNIQSEENFCLLTQQTHYNSAGKNDGIVDMVFLSQSWVCFLEMKVKASEGLKQLKTYDQLLDDSQKIDKDNKALRYCTLYLDKKDKDFKNDFAQFRWADVANFLSKFSESNQLVYEFYQFLKERKMAGNQRFTFEDILGLKVYGDVTLKMNEIFEAIKPELRDKFKAASTATGISEIRDYNRIALRCNNIIGNGNSGIVLSFKFNGSKVSDGPVMVAQLWVDDRNDKFSEFKKEASEKFSDVIFKEDEDGSSAFIQFEKPLSCFLEKEDQFKEIEMWYKSKIDKLNEYKTNSNLN